MKRLRSLPSFFFSETGNPGRELSPRTHIKSGLLSRLLWNVNRAYCLSMHGFFWRQDDPLPSRGPAILVCNHQSSVDPFILSATTRRIIAFLIAHEYYEKSGVNPLVQWMGCIPVKRDQQDIGAIRKALKALKGGQIICIFPEGGIDRGLHDSRQGAGYLSLKSGAMVIPAYIQGTPSSDSVWRSLRTPSRSRVLFGPACKPPSAGPAKPTRAEIAEWTATIMAEVSALSA